MGKMEILAEGPIVLKLVELKGGTLNRKIFYPKQNFFCRSAAKVPKSSEST